MSTLIVFTDIVEKIILIVLVLLSIWSFAIIIDRRRFFKIHLNIQNYRDIQSDMKNDKLKTNQTVDNQNFYSVVYSQFSQQSVVHIDRAYASFIKDHKENLEKGLNVLATLGANAPFIGLFGTVLGIIRAMAFLGNQSGSASVVSGVSQALYATAVGLFVAIPAVVSFNYFNYEIKKAFQKAESLKDLYIVKNQLK